MIDWHEAGRALGWMGGLLYLGTLAEMRVRAWVLGRKLAKLTREDLLRQPPDPRMVPRPQGAPACMVPVAPKPDSPASFERTMRVQRVAILLFETAPDLETAPEHRLKGATWGGLPIAVREAYMNQARVVLATLGE